MQGEILYADSFVKGMAAKGMDAHLITVGDGERSKSLDVAGSVYEATCMQIAPNWTTVAFCILDRGVSTSSTLRRTFSASAL